MKSYKEPGDKFAPDLVTSLHQISDRAYGRVPLRVNADPRLSGSDVRVYTAIAGYVFQGNVCHESYAALAGAACTSRRQVIRSVRRLIECGHIKAENPKKTRSKRWLMLMSPVFAQKQRAGIEEVAEAPSGGRRLVSTRRSA